MATYINIINSVMRRLREDTVTTPSETDYSILIGDLVNETKREVEDAWKWTALRSSVTITTVASQSGYVLTGSGQRWKFFGLKDKSVWDNTSEAYLLPQIHSAMSKDIRMATTDSSTGTPSRYIISSVDSGDSKIQLFPIPDGVYTIYVDIVIPQGDFSTGNEVLSVPDYPVILGAYAKAIAERGEDDGRTHGEALNRYAQALGDAIAIDESITTGETTWYA